MKYGILLLFLLGVSFSGVAENIFRDSAEKPLFKLEKKTVDGKSSFVVPSGRHVSGELFEIDPGSRYILTFSVKGGKKNSSSIVAFQCYDADKRAIAACQVYALPGTFTELASPARAGESSIRIADGSKWLNRRNGIAAFNAKSDNSDLPNRNYHYYIKEVKQDGETWVVEFTRPLQLNAAAKSGVRVHLDGGWLNAAIFTPAEKWQDITRMIDGRSAIGVPSNRFWAGTKYISLILYVPSGDGINISSLSLKKVK